MSPRAASRLEALGFSQVYDYVAGKADWASFGLPIEGEHGSGTRVGAHVRTDVPACAPDDRMADVRAHVTASGWDTCFVTDRNGVVVGRLGRAALAGSDEGSVEEAMTLGPSTVRPALELEQAVERMRRQNLTSLPVTRSDGVLVGVLRREDAEQALATMEET
ncbi:MAG TPA: CBS domain-containing protein [Gaiellaceae bacterium]|nr:CBS domain-containing protein [Gaiellaceae bacterium]